MAKKDSVKKTLESISSGDARGLRKHINEVLVQKVRKALDKKEKELAKNLIESVSLYEESDDKSVLSTIKKVLKSKDEFAVDPGAEYLARIPSKTAGEFYHVGVVLEPEGSKSVWKVYDQSITNQGSKTQKLAKVIKSGSFDDSNASEKAKNLEKVLQDAAKGVASGNYDSQEKSF